MTPEKIDMSERELLYKKYVLGYLADHNKGGRKKGTIVE